MAPVRRSEPKPVLSPSDPAHHRDPNEPVLAPTKERGMLERVSRLVTAVGVIALLSVVPAILNASSGTDAIQRGNDITACRAAKAAEVTDATTEWNAARSMNDILQNRFLEALVDGDTTALDGLRSQFAPVRAMITATRIRLQAVNDEYQQAVKLAVSDPDRFLQDCRHPPVTTSTTTERSVALFGAVGSTTTTSSVPTTVTTAVKAHTRRSTTTTRLAPTSTTGTTSSTTEPAPSTTEQPCGIPPLTIPHTLPCIL